MTLARVKDLWFAEVPVRDPGGKPLRDDTGHVVTAKRKTAKHPDNGGSKTAKRWLACWDDPDGKEVTGAFAKQSDAKAHAEKMEGDAKRGQSTYRNHVEPTFAKRKLKAVRPSDIKEWLNSPQMKAPGPSPTARPG
jgi:hypothetical protein